MAAGAAAISKRFAGAFAAGLVCAVLAAGCGSNDQLSIDGPAGKTLTEAAWRAFAAGNYREAEEGFENALIVDPSYADAENGLGWVHIAFGLYAEADGHFLSAIDLELANQEAEAGHAIVSKLRGDPDEALASSARALLADPNFRFSRRQGVDARDLHLLRAQAFLAKGLVLDATAEVDIVNPSNNVNPGAETFIPDLLREIERLGEQLYDF